MIAVTQNTIDAYKNTPRQTIRINYKTVGGSTGLITESDVVANGLVVNRYSASGESIQIGTCVAAELTLRLENGDGNFNSLDFEGAELDVRMGLLVNGQSTNEIYLGRFTVINSPRRLATIEIYALDHTIKLDKPVDMATLSLPQTAADLVVICCQACGFANVSGPQGASIYNMPNNDYVVTAIDSVGQMTYRNIVQWCCQIMGACAYAKNLYAVSDDYLRVTWYNKPDYTGTSYVVPTITEADRYSSDFYENAISITGIAVTKEDNTAMVGTSGYVLTIADNPLIRTADISTIANGLSARIGYNCHPFEATVLPMPYIEPLDIISFVYKGVTYDVAVSEVSIASSAPTGLKGTGKSSTSQSLASINPFTPSDIANIGSIASANQNAFSNIVVGNTTISADAETDTLTLVAGSNITLTPNAASDSITIASTGGSNSVTDVLVDGSSVVSSNVATIPYGNPNGYGVIKMDTISQPSDSKLVFYDKVTSGGTTTEFSSAVPRLDTNTEKILAKYLPLATQYVDGAMSYSDKAKLDGIASGAEVNQNAFSNVTVGNTTIEADSKTDTLTLVAGTNVTITPDATNDTITISASGGGGGGGVTDVKAWSNGDIESLVSSGVATIPFASSMQAGLITLGYSGGISGSYTCLGTWNGTTPTYTYFPTVDNSTGKIGTDVIGDLPTTGVTAGYYGPQVSSGAVYIGGIDAWTPTYYVPFMQVDDDGRLLVASNQSVANIVCRNTSIAAGYTSVSMYINPPTENNAYWLHVMGMKKIVGSKTTDYEPLIYGTDYTYRWSGYYLSIVLTQALTDVAYFKVYGNFGYSVK